MMKWEKLGRIFEFEKTPFSGRFVSHAQSPQAIVFDDFVRIYFSTRLRDAENSFISCPQYVDYSKDFSTILAHSSHEIIPRGKLGCFDEHGIFPLSPIRHEDKIFAYTSGWTRRVSVDVDTGIGIVISEDNGKTFKRIGDGPILTSSLNEPFLVADGFVQFFNDSFYMFYICGEKWSEKTEFCEPQRLYKITYATSRDGVNWVKAGKKIVKSIIENECQALPTVIKINNRYHMLFCFRDMFGFREAKSKSYRLGYAYSDDLENWYRKDDSGINISSEGWDSDMMCYPNIFKMDNEIYLLYNGNEFGKYGFGMALLKEI